MLLICFCVVMVICLVSGKVPGTCFIHTRTCSKQRCELELEVYSFERIESVRWFHNKKEIKVSDRNQFTGSLRDSKTYCTGNIVCIHSELELIMKPFLPENYGLYYSYLTTANSTRINCEPEFELKLPNDLSDDASKPESITLQTKYIYIGIGVVGGCGVLIGVLIVTVIFLARRKRNTQDLPTTARNEHRKQSSNRKPSAETSHHTYASISSDDVLHYESLNGKRAPIHQYDIPVKHEIKENDPTYINPDSKELTVISENDDDISDFSFTMDSAFSSSSPSVCPGATYNRQYSSGSCRQQRPSLHFNNGGYQDTTDLGSNICHGPPQTPVSSHDYHNIRKTRRLT